MESVVLLVMVKIFCASNYVELWVFKCNYKYLHMCMFFLNIQYVPYV